jgi:hypothetical protein
VYINLKPCLDNWYKFILNLFNLFENKLVKIPIFHNYFFLQSSVYTGTCVAAIGGDRKSSSEIALLSKIVRIVACVYEP